MAETTEGERSTADSLATVVSGGVLVSIGKFLAIGFGFLTQIVMARLLTEGAYGQVVLALAVINIAGLVAKLGLDDGLTRELPHHEDSPGEARGIVRAGFVIGVVSGTLTGLAVFVSAPVIATRVFNNQSLTPLFQTAAVGVPFIVLKSVAVSLTRGSRNASTHAYVNQIVQPTGRLIFITGLIFAGLGSIGAVVGQIAAIVTATVLALFLAQRVIPTYDAGPVRMYRSVLAFSIPLIAVQGMGFLNTNVDIYMVGYFMESSALGIYNIALQIGNLVTAILMTAGFLLPPMVTRMHKKGQTEQMRRTYQVLTKWIAVLIIPAFVVLFFAPELVIGTLFGTNYLPGTTALRILLLGKLIAIVSGLTNPVLIALGENRIVSYIVFAQTAVNVTINYLLVPTIGIEGAAIGMAASVVVGKILAVTILYGRYNLHPFTRPVFAPVFAIGTIATVGYTLLRVAGLPTVGVVLIVGIAYVPIVATLAPEPEDEQLLTRVEDRTDYDLTFVRRAFRLVR